MIKEVHLCEGSYNFTIFIGFHRLLRVMVIIGQNGNIVSVIPSINSLKKQILQKGISLSGANL